MKFSELLPVGSVVLLQKAQKKIVIIGLMPIKHLDTGEDIAYDYIGVPYPEGYIGQESAMVFNHVSINEIIFQGYSNYEREIMVETIQRIADETNVIVTQGENL